MQHSNCYSNVKNIDQIWIPGLFDGKIGSLLQIALSFLFYRNCQAPHPA